MKTKEAVAGAEKKSTLNSSSRQNGELHTDEPLGEKDEVKQAEKRTNSRPLRRRL